MPTVIANTSLRSAQAPRSNLVGDALQQRDCRRTPISGLTTRDLPPCQGGQFSSMRENMGWPS